MFVVHFFILISFSFHQLHSKQFCKSESQFAGNIHNIDYNLITNNLWKIYFYSQLKASTINQKFFPTHGFININITYDKLGKPYMERRVLNNSNFNMKFHCETVEGMVAESNITKIWVPSSTSNSSEFMITYLNEGCQTSMVLTRSKIAVHMDIDNDLIIIYTCYDVAKQESLLVLRNTDVYWRRFNNRTIEEFTLNMSTNFFRNNDLISPNFEDSCIKIAQCSEDSLFYQTGNSAVNSDISSRLIYLGSGFGIIFIFIIIVVFVNPIMDKIMTIASSKVYPITN